MSDFIHGVSRRAVCGYLVAMCIAQTRIGAQVVNLPPPAVRPLVARAQPAIPLWAAGAPGALGSTPEDQPVITPYLPLEGRANGTAVVILPGGGYQHLSMEKEGSDVANWLAGNGVTAFVVRYRLGPKYHHPAMLNDAQRAIRTVRSRAAEWRIDPHRIGVIGFSAGGHLASTAGTHFDAGAESSADPIERASSRPDFMILMYPVITMRGDSVTHRGSRTNLLGPTPDEALVRLLSNELQITRDTPPTFLVHSTDDRTVPVENSLMFYQGLRSAGVLAEMHIFEYGGHGFGLAPADPVLSGWTTMCENWMRRHGWLVAQNDTTGIVSGEPWRDVNGEVIEAHGGGILIVGKTFYWYGENHALGGGNKTGISAYSSTDLLHWKNEGVVMPKDSLPMKFRDGGVAERPKVIYNRRTKQYVMWMHLDANRYAEASAGVAVSASPSGPFKLVRIFRPIIYDYGYGADTAQLHERELGNTYRDMALFLDDDDRAYAIYASESNKTMYAVQLSDDYTDIVRPAVEGKTWARLFPSARREAPAPFKVGSKYYMISSGQSGWAPNPARYHVADHILGPWKTVGNPVVGPDSATTFRSQSTFVLPVPSACARCYIFMGDRWEARALQNSTYIWQPFVVKPDGSIRIDFVPRWNMSVFTTLR